MQVQTHTSTELPSYIKNREEFIHKCLTDLFFFCTFVLRYKKVEEYHDLNHIHRMLCDWLDRDPNPQKLNLMSRDSLKSTIGKAKTEQEFLKLCVQGGEGLIGIITGNKDLAKKHLQSITMEFLENDYIQAYFKGFVPTKETDAESWTKDLIRWKRLGIDIGSEGKSLTGGHYKFIWTDNFMNEINTKSYETCENVVEIWQHQESLLGPGSRELVSETPWRRNDVSGVILEPDPEKNFNYKKLVRRSPSLFISKTGYSVFSCFVRDEKGRLNFLPRLDETYLKRKRRKQGSWIYSRMYEGQIHDKESHPFIGLIKHYNVLPYNHIRNVCVDCAGTKEKQSSYSAISIGDTDEFGVLHIPYAEKRKVTPMELKRWLIQVVDDSTKEGRRVTYVAIEKEKYGIFLASILEEERPDFLVWPVKLKGIPRANEDGRLISLQKHYENGKILSKPGLRDYEHEVKEFHLGKNEGVDILDTIFLQFEVQFIPKKMPKSTWQPEVEDSFRAQVKRDMQHRQMPLADYVARHF